MKKMITLFLMYTITLVVNSQVCTPDQAFLSSSSIGISPNPAVNPNLPDGMVNVPYSQTFTIKVPADTNIDLSSLIGFPFPPVTATINYLEMQQPVPLPTGLAFSCEPVTCMVPGNDNGCAILQGTPTVAGQNQLFLVAMVNINVPVSVPVLGGQAISVPYLYPTFNLEILPDAAGLPETQLESISVVPNPNKGSFQLSSDYSGEYILQITNITGSEIFSSQGYGMLPEISVDLRSGTYFANISTNVGRKVIPFIVE